VSKEPKEAHVIELRLLALAGLICVMVATAAAVAAGARDRAGGQ
jgi:hypothetical protein